jgi:hypothetical protein
MMTLVGAGRENAADQLVATMEQAAGETGTNAVMTRDVGLPVAKALRAFGRGDYGAAIELIEPAAPVAQRFGGSNAQRDVVQRTFVEAAIRAGRHELAGELIAARVEVKPEALFNQRGLARLGQQRA